MSSTPQHRLVIDRETTETGPESQHSEQWIKRWRTMLVDLNLGPILRAIAHQKLMLLARKHSWTAPVVW
jgi:hypothetical protein